MTPTFLSNLMFFRCPNTMKENTMDRYIFIIPWIFGCSMMFQSNTMDLFSQIPWFHDIRTHISSEQSLLIDLSVASKIPLKCRRQTRVCQVTMCRVLSNDLQELILPRCCRHLFHQQPNSTSRRPFDKSTRCTIHVACMIHFPRLESQPKGVLKYLPGCERNPALPTSASMKFWTNWSISQIPVAAWWGSRWKSRTRRQLRQSC